MLDTHWFRDNGKISSTNPDPFTNEPIKTLKPFQSQAHNANSPKHSSVVVRNGCSVNFHLSKLSIAKFSILYDISLVRDQKRRLRLITFGSERVKYYKQ